MNLTDTLAHFDYNNLSLYQGMSIEDQAELKKTISWLLPQWMSAAQSGVDHKALILMFDEFCNPGWSSLYGHIELQAKLLATIGLGHKTRHKFYQPAARKPTTNDLTDLLYQVYPDIRTNEVVLFCCDTNIEELEDLMFDHGIPVDVQERIINQYQLVRNT